MSASASNRHLHQRLRSDRQRISADRQPRAPAQLGARGATRVCHHQGGHARREPRQSPSITTRRWPKSSGGGPSSASIWRPSTPPSRLAQFPEQRGGNDARRLGSARLAVEPELGPGGGRELDRLRDGRSCRRGRRGRQLHHPFDRECRRPCPRLTRRRRQGGRSGPRHGRHGPRSDQRRRTHRPRRRAHRRHRRPDQPPRAQRDDRGGARRRRRPRLRRRRPRGEDAGDQTAAATKEISSEIASIQSATHAAADGLTAIASTIEQVASAIEQISSAVNDRPTRPAPSPRRSPRCRVTPAAW